VLLAEQQAQTTNEARSTGIVKPLYGHMKQIRPNINNGFKSNEVKRIFILSLKDDISNAPWRKIFMKTQLRQNIINRLEQVTKVLTNPKYNPVKDGFFKPVFRAFFLCKAS
jgi:hypothetical protein